VSDLAAALMVAIRVHAAQTDKQGAPYLLHVLRVVEAVSDGAKTVAALHDVWEDGGLSVIEAGEREPFPSLNLACSLSLVEHDALQLLTRIEGVTYANYIHSVATSGNEIAREVKLADLKDNLGCIPPRPVVAHHGTAMAVWKRDWGALKARYERAIATLEATG
jgi:hypothetical protein